ncbi:MAG: hypothetical protein ABR866_05695 [Candidatus Korobacteraceae bacterium]|jgi:hypothetical protein
MSLIRKHGIDENGDAYDFQELLHNFLVANVKQAFAWGKWDCALFAASAIESFTGVDLAADFRNKYTDEAGAMATIKAVTGGTSVEDAAAYVAKQYGLAEWKTVLLAQRGDLVIYQGSEWLAAGVAHLNGIDTLFVTPKGLHKIPLRQCKRAWKVGQ